MLNSHSDFRSVRLIRTIVAAVFCMLAVSSPSRAQIGIQLQKVGESAIFQAAKNGDWQSVDYLLKAGTDPDARNLEAQQTALIIAAIWGHFDIVESLLKFGARTEIKDEYGRTALSWAAEKSQYDVIKLLLDSKANLNQQNREGLTPLMFAIKAGNAEIVELMLQHKPDLTIRDYTGRGPLAWAQTQRNRRIEDLLRNAGATG